MASSNKSENLGLNMWIPSDKPIRADFVEDNRLIDQAVGSHINNNGIHVTLNEKEKITVPYVIKTYLGTGAANLSYTFDFAPNFAAVYKIGAPMYMNVSNIMVINGAFAAQSGQVSKGIVLSANKITVEQETVSAQGVRSNLNESGAQYVIVAFK